MKKICLLLFALISLSFQSKENLNDLFENCLISDTESNITRLNPIKIIAIDAINNRIKTNYTELKNLLIQPTNDQSWFVTQGEEASGAIEILSLDLNTGWITLGKSYARYFEIEIDATLEFFNPFINYKIIHNRPLFEEYPTHINDEYINYIQAGGIIKRAINDYVLLTPVVFGQHSKRSIYYATSTDLEHWDFQDQKILDTQQIPFAKKSGNVFSTGNPLKMEDGSFLVLLGVEQPNGNYTSAYMIIDRDLNMIQTPQEIKIPVWHGVHQNSFPLSIIKYDGTYRVLFHRRSNNLLESEIYEITTKNIIKAFNENKGIISTNIIHSAKSETGYLHGKADDASYVKFNLKLYIILGSEEVPSEYLTSLNRQYGLLELSENKWTHDKRSPLIVNPISVSNKYIEYDWASDHLGGFISPIFSNGFLYMFLTFGSDNPDYFLAGIKVKTN